MFHLTTTATNTLISAYDEGDDIIVVISSNKPKPDDAGLVDTLAMARTFVRGHVFTQLADEMGTTIMPIV